MAEEQEERAEDLLARSKQHLREAKDAARDARRSDPAERQPTPEGSRARDEDGSP
ncbi:hypothetical protein [Amycolatopsis suaedae]|uniref:hypothetical protein n=1 Tax=Amycolatopsis suaedae TaxID=2510978 RepID=UPI0013EEEF8D|nr:hypothetical protein [Amycolatopsis suaedae]